VDLGTVVMHGGVDIPRDESSITVRTFFIDDAPAWQLARGAIEKRRKSGRSAMVIDANPVVIDHLHDIYQAMRSESRVRTVVLLGRLIEENAAVYEPWGSDDLAAALREYKHLGLDIRKSHGDSVVRLEEVEQALRERT
jgi:S-DNA-T family DNA segregation ATPase FtsK/SpoIIIE